MFGFLPLHSLLVSPGAPSRPPPWLRPCHTPADADAGVPPPPPSAAVLAHRRLVHADGAGQAAPVGAPGARAGRGARTARLAPACAWQPRARPALGTGPPPPPRPACRHARLPPCTCWRRPARPPPPPAGPRGCAGRRAARTGRQGARAGPAAAAQRRGAPRPGQPQGGAGQQGLHSRRCAAAAAAVCQGPPGGVPQGATPRASGPLALPAARPPTRLPLLPRPQTTRCCCGWTSSRAAGRWRPRRRRRWRGCPCRCGGQRGPLRQARRAAEAEGPPALLAQWRPGGQLRPQLVPRRLPCSVGGSRHGPWGKAPRCCRCRRTRAGGPCPARRTARRRRRQRWQQQVGRGAAVQRARWPPRLPAWCRCAGGCAARDEAQCNLPPSGGIDGEEEEDALVCSICLEAVALGAEVLSLPCRHQFHEDCITPWLRQQGAGATCPMCKSCVFQ
jgi:hypothetical protein